MEEKKNETFNYNDCPLRYFLNGFGNKWALLVLYILSNEFDFEENKPMRFGKIYKSIESISQKMLTQTLKSLEADGLVIRKVYPQVPPKVEYRLSELGQSLIPVISNLSDWAEENKEKMITSRKKFNR